MVLFKVDISKALVSPSEGLFDKAQTFHFYDQKNIREEKLCYWEYLVPRQNLPPGLNDALQDLERIILGLLVV